jgi:L-alanine-DL-glutamate epimerase-like enolase superfamily enzyme
MKIRDVRAYVLEAALSEPFAYSQASYERRGACLVEIIGADGSSGWGEAFGPPRLTAPIVESYKPLLIGADALATEAIWQTLYNRLRDHGQKGLAIEALSAVDPHGRVAATDRAARRLGRDPGRAGSRHRGQSRGARRIRRLMFPRSSPIAAGPPAPDIRCAPRSAGQE